MLSTGFDPVYASGSSPAPLALHRVRLEAGRLAFTQKERGQYPYAMLIFAFAQVAHKYSERSVYEIV